MVDLDAARSSIPEVSQRIIDAHTGRWTLRQFLPHMSINRQDVDE